MDVARCTLNGESYTVRQFEGLSEHHVAQLRRFLACPVCAGPAFYRKESTSGQAACFGARPHAPGCSLAAAEPRYRGGAGPDQVERINSGERIEIDFVYGAGPVTHVNPNEPANPQGRGGRFVGGGRGPSNAVMHRRLSTLLKNLMHSDGFRNSDQLIAMPAGEFRVRNFFVEFSDIDGSHEGAYRGYWGMISDAKGDGGGSLWLNSGGRDDVSIVIPNELVNVFAQRFNVDDIEELAGAYALFLGELKISQNGKAYLACNDIQAISVSLAE